LACAVLLIIENRLRCRVAIAASANRQFQFQKRGQPFIRTHNETLSVAAMRVSNPDRLRLRINR
jgi:hypothetical protein